MFFMILLVSAVVIFVLLLIWAIVRSASKPVTQVNKGWSTLPEPAPEQEVDIATATKSQLQILRKQVEMRSVALTNMREIEKARQQLVEIDAQIEKVTNRDQAILVERPTGPVGRPGRPSGKR